MFEGLGLVLVLFFLGLFLLIVEFFLVPGFALPGKAGILLVLGACVASIHEYGPLVGAIASAVMLLTGGTVSVMGLKMLPNTRAGKLLILDRTLEDSALPEREHANLRIAVGSKGVALSDLRPAGNVRLEGEDYEVTCEGFARAGERVVVVRVQSDRIVVRTEET